MAKSARDSIDLLDENISTRIPVAGESIDVEQNTEESNTLSEEPDFAGDSRTLPAIGDKIEIS